MSDATRFDAIAQGSIDIPVNRHLGFRIEGRDGDEVVFSWLVPEEYCNSAGGLQGGMLAAFADAVLGGACALELPPERYPALAEMKVSLLRPVSAGTKLTGRGRVIKSGRRVLFAEADVTDDRGRLVARASGTEIPADMP
ncbi:MAG TPA: PaaI family thioesterase [Actinomycetota bacterium]|jgi:uncharacterized protein (TIGR00369 family)|nr:PaaI family thioesterase [Actinomycetota bacterium]